MKGGDQIYHFVANKRMIMDSYGKAIKAIILILGSPIIRISS